MSGLRGQVWKMVCALWVCCVFGVAHASAENMGLPESTFSYPAVDWGDALKGLASYYGKTRKFHGRPTASGERFDPRLHTAASNRFPLGTWVMVKRRDTGHCTVVKVNDRMHSRHKARVVDLSLAAAKVLDMLMAGIVAVDVWALPGPPAEGGGACPPMPDLSPEIPEFNLSESLSEN